MSPELEGVIVHRPRDLGDLEPSVRSGITTTNPLRMLCDLGAVDPKAVAGAVERVIIDRIVTPTALRSLVERHSLRGRHGVVALREAVMAWPLGDKPADSVLEPAMAMLLADHGLPPADSHVMIEGYEVDFLIRGTPVVVGCDGWAFHVAQRERWARDQDRDAVLLAAGYPTVRSNWERITSEPGRVAAKIEAVLRRWAPEVLHQHRAS
jgi:hypothetical protein